VAPLFFKMGLADSAPSSKATLSAVLALTSLHMGRQDEAMLYKARAISHLSRSLTTGTGARVSFQHIAASMLISLYEVLL
jgi:hypothetical protein